MTFIIFSLQLTWFGWSSELRHEAFWSDARKEISLLSGQESLQLMYKVCCQNQSCYLVETLLLVTERQAMGLQKL